MSRRAPWFNTADWAPCVVMSTCFCSKMALFESASKQLVKDTGRSSLLPVLDLNSSSKQGIMCVVEKKKSRWFWRKTKYLPTPFTLNEILLEPVDHASIVKATEFVANYENDPSLHVSGKLGAKLAGELGIDVSTADSFTVKLNLGTLNKSEIRWQDLNNLLKDKKLNLEHEFVKGILKSRRRKLCIVNEVLTTTKDTNIQSDLQIQGDADAKGSVTSKAEIDVEGSVKDTHHHSFDIPKDTVMAYSCYEFNFDDGFGMIELAIEKKLEDVTDAAPEDARAAQSTFDHPDGQDSALTSIFNTLLKSPKKDDVIKCFKQILSTPENLKPIAELLEKAVHSVEGDKVKPYTVHEFKTLVEHCKGWEKLLTLLGFTIEKKKDGVIVFPGEEAKDLILPCSALADALMDLSSQQCLALKNLTPEHVEPLLYLIRNAMYGKNTPEDDQNLKRIYTHAANHGKTFLLALGFVETTEDGKKVLTLPSTHFTPLEDAYVTVFVIGSK